MNRVTKIVGALLEADEDFNARDYFLQPSGKFAVVLHANNGKKYYFADPAWAETAASAVPMSAEVAQQKVDDLVQGRFRTNVKTMPWRTISFEPLDAA